MRPRSSACLLLFMAASCAAQTPPALTPLPVASGLDAPTMVANAHDGSDRLYVVEQSGRIRIVRDGKLLDRPFLDIQSRVLRSPNEQGMLSVVFPPDYAEKKYFYVDYTALPDGHIRVARYRTTGDPELADPASEEVVLSIARRRRSTTEGCWRSGPRTVISTSARETERRRETYRTTTR